HLASIASLAPCGVSCSQILSHLYNPVVEIIHTKVFCAPAPLISGSLTRQMAAESLDRAIQSFRERVGILPERKFERRAEEVELACLNAASSVMAQHAYFRRPYHLVDVLRQMSDQVLGHRDEVVKVDRKLNDVLTAAGVGEGLVSPREAIPGLATVAITSAHILGIWDAGETRAQAIEFRQLAEDLLFGREWHLSELRAAANEARQEANRTGLESLRTVRMWFEWEHWFAANNYRVLDGIPEADIMFLD
ncbi:MAG: hypothetical protein NT105_20645, partial [Verrucomicrobia bacterium]|nr:hypothetical protein [Verrucomicrobiota bacterium]